MNRRRRSRRWPGRLLRVALWLFAAVGLLFAAVQVALATPWARNRVARSIEARIGLPATVDRLGWTPWGGARIAGLRIGQPEALAEVVEEPLLDLESCRIWPDYRAMLEGRVDASSIEIEGPKLTVAVEMLVALAGSAAPPVGEPPAVALEEGSTVNPGGERAPEIAAGTGSQPAVGPPPAGPGEGAGAPSAPSPEGGPKAAPAQEPAPGAPSGRPLWLRVRGGDLRLIRAAGPELFSFGGLDLVLPLRGAEGEGRLDLEDLQLLGKSIETNVEVRGSGRARQVEIAFKKVSENQSYLMGNVRFAFIPGIPFQAQVGVGLEGGTLEALGLGSGSSIGRLKVGIATGGWLRQPASWAARLEAEGETMAMALAGLPVRFDRAEVTAELVGGVLRVPDGRLVGDELALLGNGWLNRSGGSGVVRLVVSESGAGAIGEQVAERVPGAAIPWERLLPGQRLYADLRIWREPEGWVTDLGASGRVLPLSEVVERP